MKTQTRNRWKPKLPETTIEVVKDLQGEQLYGYLVCLRDKGWSLSAIATPLGLSRERVRQVTENVRANSLQYEVPELPTKPVKERVEKVVIEPSSEVVSRLLELQPMAQSVRGKSQKYRAQGEEYTRLIASEIQRGVITSHLADKLGVTHSALNFRLVRYGYAETSSSAKCYRPIAYGNTNTNTNTNN